MEMTRESHHVYLCLSLLTKYVFVMKKICFSQFLTFIISLISRVIYKVHAYSTELRHRQGSKFRIFGFVISQFLISILKNVNNGELFLKFRLFLIFLAKNHSFIIKIHTIKGV